jgi:hypothetical protein
LERSSTEIDKLLEDGLPLHFIYGAITC